MHGPWASRTGTRTAGVIVAGAGRRGQARLSSRGAAGGRRGQSDRELCSFAPMGVIIRGRLASLSTHIRSHNAVSAIRCEEQPCSETCGRRFVVPPIVVLILLPAKAGYQRKDSRGVVTMTPTWWPWTLRRIVVRAAGCLGASTVEAAITMGSPRFTAYLGHR
jgi:hypothetical protein